MEHYGKLRLYRVKKKTLGKGFVECYTLQTPYHTVKIYSTKASLLSAFYQALDECLLACHLNSRQQKVSKWRDDGDDVLC
jgi:hypothetical protein